MGNRIAEAANELFEANSYRDYLELHGLSVQLTEALAEYWHARIRADWGIAAGDSPHMARILKQEYTGERYSFGYPACPDLSQQQLLFKLLRPERVGVQLSEEFQLHPEQSTSAIIFHHPEAAYFNAGLGARLPSARLGAAWIVPAMQHWSAACPAPATTRSPL